MPASTQVFDLCVSQDAFIAFMGASFPLLRLHRGTRSAIDTRHLRNALWGKQCGHCDRRPRGTFVYVDETEEGKPNLYVCWLCKHGYIYEADMSDSVRCRLQGSE